MTAVVETKDFQLPRRLRGLQPTLIRQFFERALPGSINFGLGEPDLPTPDFLRKEAARISVEEASFIGRFTKAQTGGLRPRSVSP